ncbi:hypothetical protein BASA81_001159 [Batrachochytrium salamandrivorans]|nr:hypothetical protein BASA81_001159 [Batrachochytrium salamandrivorans]
MSVAADADDHQAFLINAGLLVLSALGGLHLLHVAFSLATFVYRTWIRKPHDLHALYGKGGWVCITGATDGVGKSIALEAAKRGLNVFLISRTEQKLKDTQEEILSKYKVQVEYLQVDFSSSKVDYSTIQAKLLELNGVGLTVLVNNVGVSYDYPTYFEELSETRIQELIRLNVDSTTNMTRVGLFVFKHKKAQQQRRRGGIVNLASAAGLTSNPLLTQYSAAKAYVQRFSEGLAVELKPQGIDVQVHVPFFIVSKMSKFRSSSFMVPSSDKD